MAWPPSAVLEGGARREALGGMESELVPTEPSQTYPIASVCRLSIIEKRPTNLLVGLFFYISSLLTALGFAVLVQIGLSSSDMSVKLLLQLLWCQPFGFQFKLLLLQVILDLILE